MEQAVQFELSQEFLDRLKQAIEEKDSSFIVANLNDVNHADVSAVLEELDTDESKFVLFQLDDKLAAEVLTFLEEDTRKEFVPEISTDKVSRYMEWMETDDAADILNELPIRNREEVLAKIQNKEKSRHIQELLRYDDDCAGGLMAKELIKANVNWSVIQCIEEIRRQAEQVDKIYSVYVVDDDDRLLGKVSLKRIILSSDNTKIADLYDDNIQSVKTYQDADEVAAIMQKYDLEAIPVINIENRLVGRITIDDVVDVITELAEQERQIMAGISEDVEEDDNVWVLSRARLPWLIIGLVGGMAGAKFIGLFEEDLMKVTALAFFIPLITATGGNVGIQSSALVVQGLASHSAFGQGAMQRLVKVLMVAILNGLVLAGIVFAFVTVIENMQLAYVVSVALFSVVMLASILGTLIPLALDKIGLNPALASGPFITTTIDLLGLTVYFLVAHWLYSGI